MLKIGICPGTGDWITIKVTIQAGTARRLAAARPATRRIATPDASARRPYLNSFRLRLGLGAAREDDHMSKTSVELAFVALGSNLGDSAEVVRQALEKLQSLSAAPLLRSSLWQTTPVDCPPGSPLFINAVAGLRPRVGETPATLLRRLQKLEEAFGRTPKKILNEPRRLDLDLIAFGSRIMHGPGLELPHPRAHLRRFVLQPLAEIAPDFILPGQRRSVQELLGRLPLEAHPPASAIAGQHNQLHNAGGAIGKVAHQEKRSRGKNGGRA
jgi:2-amino-4-hydroxy-6-hydroxymethyldihydropteridine diphosphokinase